MNEPADEQLHEWELWLAALPENVRLVAERLPPWKLYWLKSPGQRVRIISYDEPLEEGDAVTVSVSVGGDVNALVIERNVFGINPDDLEPCDPPASDELTGVLFEGEMADKFVEQACEVIQADRRSKE